MDYQPLSFVSDEEYEEYLLSQPLEARFDYLTIQSAVQEAFPKHEAYGMLYEEYQKHRSRFAEYDPTEKKQLTFYLPSFIGSVAIDMALKYKLPSYHFISTMLELGLIHFHVDYHEDYRLAKVNREQIYDGLKTITMQRHYEQVRKQAIELGSGLSYREGKSKKFSPSIPLWLYNAVTDISGYLNISRSDVVYLCWCIAVVNCTTNATCPPVVTKRCEEVCDEFNFELSYYSKTVEAVYANMLEDSM